MRLAAIDIGSNAVRLLIQDVAIYKDGSLDITKVNLFRVPLRLGFDVFERGFISVDKSEKLVKTMNAFREFLDVYEVKHCRICATSAMRDATNSTTLVKQIADATGLWIEIISGSEEAQILYETHLAENLDAKNSYLYIDVGGGSTELTLFSKGEIIAKKSFNIGTIRILKDKVDDAQWDEMKNFVKLHSKNSIMLSAIGTGGNINKVLSISNRKKDKPIRIDELRTYYKEMSKLSMEERMHAYGFREDRADVIVPALEIYTSVMRWADIKEIFVPQIGLADGIIKLLYQQLSFTSLMGKR
ncbi:MAG TPA: ethanolamine ammonia-lyase reactivating factor EutA [Chitinophagaceae bacterium]|nr:ethanolamine ammonia-lyase reactivating factor EutA [Chitinophagaceae bacterium]